jgi:hypothetical protein
MRRARFIAAVACVAFAALLPAAGVILQLASTSDWFRPRDDPVSEVDRRYAALRETLRGERVVGYVPPVPSTTNKTYNAYLVIARYTLAPTYVVYNTKQRLLIVDGVAGRSSVPPDFTVRRDFGGGLVLLERPAR